MSSAWAALLKRAICRNIELARAAQRLATQLGQDVKVGRRFLCVNAYEAFLVLQLNFILADHGAIRQGYRKRTVSRRYFHRQLRAAGQPAARPNRSKKQFLTEMSWVLWSQAESPI
jgi:hypothetical protein